MKCISSLLVVAALTVPSYRSVIEEEAAFAEAAIEAGVIPALDEATDLVSAYAMLGAVKDGAGLAVGMGRGGDAISDRRATLRDISAGAPIDRGAALLCVRYYMAVLSGIELMQNAQPLTVGQVAIQHRAARELEELQSLV